MIFNKLFKKNATQGKTMPPDLKDPRQFDDAYRQLAPQAIAAARRVLRDDAAAEDVDEQVIRRDRTRRLAGAIKGLPAEQRDALLLAYGRGMSASEIAEAA